MRPQLTAPGLLLLLACASQAGVTIKGETQVAEHRLGRLSVEGAPEGAAVLWEYDEDRLDADEQPGGRIVFAGPPGTYKLRARAITLGKDGRTQVETARVTVVIGKAPPPPQPPGPRPPDPPPAPQDLFVRSLRDAYASAADADKAKHMASLAAVYRKAADLDLSGVQTAGDLYGTLKDATRSMGLADDTLRGVRLLVASELKKVLPADAGERLAADHKVTAKAAFYRIGKALEEAAK